MIIQVLQLFCSYLLLGKARKIPIYCGNAIMVKLYID